MYNLLRRNGTYLSYFPSLIKQSMEFIRITWLHFIVILLLHPNRSLATSFDDVLEASEASRPAMIVEIMKQQKTSLQSKTVRLLTSSTAFRIGMPASPYGGQDASPNFQGVQKSEFILSVDRLFYGSPDLHNARWPLRKVTYDGVKSNIYQFTSTTKVKSLDIHCNRPSVHEVIMPFVEGTGLSSFSDMTGRLEMEEVFGRFLEYDWKGVETHPQLGRVLVLFQPKDLPGGSSEVRSFFGDRMGELVYLGTESIDLSDPTRHPDGKWQRSMFSVHIDYDDATGYVLPSKWNRIRSTVVGDLDELDSLTPTIRSAVRTVVTKCEVLDVFPEHYLEIKIQRDTQVYDHCNPAPRKAPVAAAIVDQGDGNRIWWMVIGAAIFAIATAGYLKLRNQRAAT